MSKKHTYAATVNWTSEATGSTTNYRSYSRDHTLQVQDKADILASADPAFRGDKTRHNPEDMLVAATASCHMLWYLHFCAVNGVEVLSYTDTAVGTMNEGSGQGEARNGGHFAEITLNPVISISEKSDPEKALVLHHDANKECFIANTLKCPVHHNAEITITT